MNTDDDVIRQAAEQLGKAAAESLKTPEGYAWYIECFGRPPMFIDGLDICIVMPPKMQPKP